MSELDLQRGTYRRIYSGMIWGKRINSVSLQAEAWFWRLNVIADDFGNLPGDVFRVLKETSGRRDVSSKAVQEWIDELVHARLLVAYEAEGESYLHIVGFGSLQPAGKNGRRARRHPASPLDAAESGDSESGPGESGGFREIQAASGSVSGSGSKPPPPPTPVRPAKPAAAVAARGRVEPPKGRAVVFEAMVLAGVSERKAFELAENPHVRTEDVRRIQDRRRQAGKAADGSLITEIQTAARQVEIREQRKAAGAKQAAQEMAAQAAGGST